MDGFRRLLLVSPRSCEPGLARELENHLWKWEQVADTAEATAAMSPGRFDVALLLEQDDSTLAAAEFEACAARDPGCAWVGVFRALHSERPPWRGHILAHFFDHHTGEVHPAQLCQSLGQAYGRTVLHRIEGEEKGSADTQLGMVGQGPAVRELRTRVRKAGASEMPVLISGESGSGKELVARALHNCSRRAKGPFVAVNCGALAPTLIHSELFGHERGSFSGASASRRGLIESARGGTLFLDEIAELPLDLQATILRFLQEKTIVRVGSEQVTQADTRVIAASHVDLVLATAAGTFREDLYFRLGVLEINVPSLRDRREDIPLIARHFFDTSGAKRATQPRGFSSEAMAAMVDHRWPGNVRELHNRVQRALVMAEHRLISPADLGLDTYGSGETEDLQTTRLRAEAGAIRHALERVDRNVTLAAGDLGISRMTLYRLMAKHGIALEVS